MISIEAQFAMHGVNGLLEVKDHLALRGANRASGTTCSVAG